MTLCYRHKGARLSTPTSHSHRGQRDGAAIGKHRRRRLIRQMTKTGQQRTMESERHGYRGEQ